MFVFWHFTLIRQASFSSAAVREIDISSWTCLIPQGVLSTTGSPATIFLSLIPESMTRLIFVMHEGHGTLLAKIDTRDAYRLIPVHPHDRYLLGMAWNNQLYVDLALPFGLSGLRRCHALGRLRHCLVGFPACWGISLQTGSLTRTWEKKIGERSAANIACWKEKLRACSQAMGNSRPLHSL